MGEGTSAERLGHGRVDEAPILDERPDLVAKESGVVVLRRGRFEFRDSGRHVGNRAAPAAPHAAKDRRVAMMRMVAHHVKRPAGCDPGVDRGLLADVQPAVRVPHDRVIDVALGRGQKAPEQARVVIGVGHDSDVDA